VVTCTGIDESEFILCFGIKNDRVSTSLVAVYLHPLQALTLVSNFVITRGIMRVRAYCSSRGWRRLYRDVRVFYCHKSKCLCKGILLEVCLVTWVGSHLRAVILPITFSLSPIFPSVSYRVMPLVLILDSV